MKKFLLVLAPLFVVLAACSTNSGSTVESEPETSVASEQSSAPASISSTISTEPETKSSLESQNILESKQVNEVKSSDLFENVYVKYASRENPFAFTAVQAFVKASGYKNEIVEPTDTALGTIKAFADNGDYVYFNFSPDNSGIETVSTVSYYQDSTKSEVSLNNYSLDRGRNNDKLSTHIIGESNRDVSSVDEQRKFLFS